MLRLAEISRLSAARRNSSENRVFIRVLPVVVFGAPGPMGARHKSGESRNSIFAACIAASEIGHLGAVKSARSSTRYLKPHAYMSEYQVRSDFGDFPLIPTGLHFYVAHPFPMAALTAIRQWRIMDASGADRDFHLYEADHGSAQR